MEKDNNKFLDKIEKRIRKYTRINHVFEKDDRVLVIGDLCHYYASKIVESLPIRFIRSKGDKIDKLLIKKEKINKILVPLSIDDEICSFLSSIFYRKKSRGLDLKGCVVIGLFRVVTDEELERSASLLGIRFKVQKKDQLIMKFLEKLGKKHPEIYYSLGNSVKEIGEKIV